MNPELTAAYDAFERINRTFRGKTVVWAEHNAHGCIQRKEDYSNFTTRLQSWFVLWRSIPALVLTLPQSFIEFNSALYRFGQTVVAFALRTRVSCFDRLRHVPIYWFNFNKAAVRKVFCSPIDSYILLHCPTVASIWRQKFRTPFLQLSQRHIGF